MSDYLIQPCSAEHIKMYAQIYARAFSGEPWNDAWSLENAETHIQEIMESKHSFGLEYTLNDTVVGFILGSSMMFHYGRVFEINDLAVDPAHQKKGIASQLLNMCMQEVRARGYMGINLITANDGFLSKFYEKYGFIKENKVILMSREL